MRFTKIERLNNGQARVTVANNGSIERKTLLTVGATYTIKPLNPKKLRNRDRTCEIVDFCEGTRTGSYVSIRFLDNGRRGRTDFDELLPE